MLNSKGNIGMRGTGTINSIARPSMTGLSAKEP
jgi:hypothetical protein